MEMPQLPIKYFILVKSAPMTSYFSIEPIILSYSMFSIELIPSLMLVLRVKANKILGRPA